MTLTIIIAVMQHIRLQIKHIMVLIFYCCSESGNINLGINCNNPVIFYTDHEDAPRNSAQVHREQNLL